MIDVSLAISQPFVGHVPCKSCLLETRHRGQRTVATRKFGEQSYRVSKLFTLPEGSDCCKWR
jgi:hypothetical protein